jgi:hypothetical protein
MPFRYRSGRGGSKCAGAKGLPFPSSLAIAAAHALRLKFDQCLEHQTEMCGLR